MDNYIQQNSRSHFILGGLNYYALTSKNKYNVLIVFIMYFKTLLLLRWDTGKVRDRFSGMGRFKCGLRCNRWVNSVIINVITELNYRCNNMQVFKKYKYNVKACMYTISALYQMINLNVRTQYKATSYKVGPNIILKVSIWVQLLIFLIYSKSLEDTLSLSHEK